MLHCGTKKILPFGARKNYGFLRIFYDPPGIKGRYSSYSFLVCYSLPFGPANTETFVSIAWRCVICAATVPAL